MITTEVLPALGASSRCARTGTGCFGEREREPSVSYAWSRACCATTCARPGLVHVVLRRNGQCEGIVPMARAARENAGAGDRHPPAHPGEIQHAQRPAARGEPDLLAAWFEQLLRLPRRWDVLHMSRLLEDSPLADSRAGAGASRRAASRAGSSSRRITSTTGHLRGIPGRAQRQVPQLPQARRARSRQAGRGRLRRVPAAAASSRRVTRELLDIERDSWKHEHGTAISAVARQRVSIATCARRPARPACCTCPSCA